MRIGFGGDSCGKEADRSGADHRLAGFRPGAAVAEVREESCTVETRPAEKTWSSQVTDRGTDQIGDGRALGWEAGRSRSRESTGSSTSRR
nr:hypothetical protein [Streptomyces sp. KS 21]